MRRRTLLYSLAALAFALLLASSLGPILFPRPCPVTEAALNRIEVGMTREQVYSIMGGPPGDYRTQPTVFDTGPGIFPSSKWPPEWCW